MTELLSDVTMVDLTRALAGPHAGMMFADLGARVIKVETPDGGDDSRGWGPPFVGNPADRDSTYFMSCNRNKESVTADLKSDEGKELLRRLVRRADVLCENFRPGVLDRLGFSVEQLHELNPGLVILSITGFGHDGPEGGRSGYDQIAQGEGGLMSLTGVNPEEPTKVGVPIADLLVGMYGAFGVLAALLERTRTGRGRGRAHEPARRDRGRARVPGHPLHGRRRRADRDRQPTTPRSHRTGCSTLPTPRCRSPSAANCCGSAARRLPASTPTTRGSPPTATASPTATTAIEQTFTTGSAEDWLARLADAGVPAGKVRTLDDVFAWEQTLSQGLLVDVEHPTGGAIRLPGPPLRFDDNTHAGAHEKHAPPPRLGQHDESVRAWLDELDERDGRQP